MQTATSNDQESETADDIDPATGPAAHEDLTIAEHIQTMRVSDEHRPGEECFLNSHGEKHWVTADDARRFIRRVGAQHPSDYLATYGESWEKDFFSGF
jgi:hypothetical protein